MPDVVLVDLALDYAATRRLASADQCQPAYQAGRPAAGLRLRALADGRRAGAGRHAHRLHAANEAADAVNQGVCSAADADMAMQKGVNYPRGPAGLGRCRSARIPHGDVLRNLAPPMAKTATASRR
jgi:3-hydroxybutyryl-CoA dehydrogenase